MKKTFSILIWVFFGISICFLIAGLCVLAKAHQNYNEYINSVWNFVDYGTEELRDDDAMSLIDYILGNRLPFLEYLRIYEENSVIVWMCVLFSATFVFYALATITSITLFCLQGEDIKNKYSLVYWLATAVNPFYGMVVVTCVSETTGKNNKSADPLQREIDELKLLLDKQRYEKELTEMNANKKAEIEKLKAALGSFTKPHPQK